MAPASAAATAPAALSANERLAIAGSAAFVVILGLVAWRRKRAAMF
jgi:hypothetical protein